MKSNLPKIVAFALLFMTASAQALEPEVIYAFQLGPTGPAARLVEGSDGNFYGTTPGGGSSGYGTVFKVTTNGVLTMVVSFTRTNGAYPQAELVLGGDGNFYGTTSDGGRGYGTVFKVTTNGVLTSLVSFSGANGAYPAGLVLGRDDNFYGTTQEGGATGVGTVFRVTTNGELTALISFSGTNGAYPRAGLVLGSDGDYYGTTLFGGSSGYVHTQPGYGTVFKMTTNGVLTSLVSFNGTNGANPQAALVLGSDGHFYGTTPSGGPGGGGTVFRMTPNGVLTRLVSFNDANGRGDGDGSYPRVGLVLGSDGNFYGTTPGGGSSGHGTVFKVTTNGVLTTLVSFNDANGAGPEAGLVLGRDGNFYGTSSHGGSSSYNSGTVFKVTPNGVLTTLFLFAYTDGPDPQAGLLLGRDGNFYGTTAHGGRPGYGSVFKVTTNGVMTTLVSFSGTNGAYPRAGLVLGADGNFYGTTADGGGTIGNPTDPSGFGTVFQMTTNGALTSLVSFNGANGGNPQAALVLGSDGDLYGTTSGGRDSNGYGTVFKVTTNGMLTTLVSFNDDNEPYPYTPNGGLVLGNDGAFYGTTSYDGEKGSSGTVFKVTTNGVLTTLVSFPVHSDVYPHGGLALGSDGNFYGTTSRAFNRNSHGTVFRMTANGELTTLVSFNGANGANPQAALVLGNDGAFYGTTASGGSSGGGTVFRVTTSGVLTTIVSFTGGDGISPQAGLVVGGDGNLYGTAPSGGPGGGGTIFRLVISAFTRVARQPNGSMLLTGTGPLNGGYRLWASADLSLPVSSWTLLTSASFDSNGNFFYTDASAATYTSRFYQLSVP